MRSFRNRYFMLLLPIQGEQVERETTITQKMLAREGAE